MIAVEETVIHQAMRILSEVSHPEAHTISQRLRLAMYEAVERDAKFNNELPALVRRRA
jgi:hypothetical protein